jgi:uncharacterized protein (DUF362 family)
MTSKKITRKNYLKYASLVAVGVAGSTSILWKITKKNQTESPPITTPYQEHISPTTITSTSQMKELTTSPSPLPKNGKSSVSIVSGNSDIDIDAMVRRSVDLVGGIGSIVSPGAAVVVKPPVLTSNKGCSPDAKVVAAVVKLVQEAQGKVIVAESSGSGSTLYNLSKIGIASAVEKLGVEVKDLQTEKEVTINVPSGIALHEVNTYPTIVNCDVLISVPRLKRHSGATVTISLKNMMGTLPQDEMRRFHRINLSQCIADLNTAIKPHLTVIDASSAMTRTGPTGGDMVKMDMVFASTDPVAADRIGAQKLQELEEKIGSPSQFNASEVKHINFASALNIGTNDLESIELVQEIIT